MSTIKKLILKDVRCFEGDQAFNMRPLTFLIGENSTGKSTALACFQILSNFIQREDVDFNIDPYQMGAFIDIVRKSRPKNKNFKISFEFEYRQRNRGQDKDKIVSFKYALVLEEKEKGSEPVVREYKFIFDDGEITVKEKKSDPQNKPINPRGIEEIGVEKTDGQKNNFVVEMPSKLFENNILFFRMMDIRFLDFSPTKENATEQEKEFSKFIGPKLDFFDFLGMMSMDENVSSFAPIRSKPQRTYDPLKEVESPEGSDMPMVLMNMKKADPEKWKSIREKLIEFGKASGLFTDIAVRKHGDSMSDPFQLQIKVKGPKVNLIDVGYGVSQILPILVRVLNARREHTFLLQQPEVHLHPKGQAALSSLLIANCQHRHSFIIETHSEYMINRASIEIRNGNITPKDVSLIYLEAKGNKVIVHNITFDKEGNLENVPSGYNDFLMKETNRFIGLED